MAEIIIEYCETCRKRIRADDVLGFNPRTKKVSHLMCATKGHNQDAKR